MCLSVLSSHESFTDVFLIFWDVKLLLQWSGSANRQGLQILLEHKRPMDHYVAVMFRYVFTHSTLYSHAFPWSILPHEAPSVNELLGQLRRVRWPENWASAPCIGNQSNALWWGRSRALYYCAGGVSWHREVGGYMSWIHVMDTHDTWWSMPLWNMESPPSLHQDRSLSRGLVQRTFPVRALQSAVRMWDGNLSLCMLQMKDLH